MRKTVCRLTHRRAPEGFSLVELLAVLVIVVALSGLLVTQLPNFVRQAHRSTGASNMAQTNNSVNTFLQLQGEQPNQLDSLIADGTSDLYFKASDTDPGLPSATAADGTDLNLMATATLTAGTLDSLNGAGITEVIDHGTGNATFESADINGVARTLAVGGEIATLGSETFGTAAATNFTGLPDLDAAGDAYAVFGLGRNATIIGETIAEPPIHFDSDNPGTNYSRFGLVFEVFENGSPAEFKGTVAFHGDNIVPYWRAHSGFRAEQFEE
jgi:prepilin-type N-terminal cleavage/methylation domain-containing protein